MKKLPSNPGVSELSVLSQSCGTNRFHEVAAVYLTILVAFVSDQKEFPVPEQFKTAWDGSKLVTEPAEIVG